MNQHLLNTFKALLMGLTQITIWSLFNKTSSGLYRRLGLIPGFAHNAPLLVLIY